MIRNVWISLLVLPGLALSQWVQVGFISSETGRTMPEKVVLASRQGEWHREILLSERYSMQIGCAVSEPLVLPKHKIGGPLALSWEQGGSQYSYEFEAPYGQPLQILLDQPKFQADKPNAEMALETALTVAPNPFNPVSNISLNLPEAAHLRLEVFDILGRQVALLNDSHLPAGAHHWVADGSLWSSGTYFLSYRLSPGQSGVRRMQLLK
ncbi:MAG: T9SS type A sorting domain-containing protein [Calditrichaeota bacterium]|nr:T9SS type A sorting domain-containing protein [Calditrichota bacterium]